MRRTRLMTVALVGLAVFRPAPAQSQALLDRCSGITASQIEVQGALLPYSVPQDVVDQVQFLCEAVATTMSNLQPSVGIGFSGANPVLGTAATLGTRFGMVPRFSVTARVNGAFADMPDIFSDYAAQLSDAQDSLSTVPTTLIPVGSLQADLALGVFNGFGMGPALGGLGSIDLLGSVSFIPAISALEDAGITEAIVNYGLGARVGILNGGILMPALSVSGMYRHMGEIQFGDIADGDPGQFSTDLSTLSLRAVVSKGLMIFDLAAGAGYDKYTSDPSFNFALECRTTDCQTAGGPDGVTLTMADDISGSLETAAWNVFANVGFNLFVARLVGEVGYQKATDVITGDDLSSGRSITRDDLGGGRLFGSVGLRIGL